MANNLVLITGSGGKTGRAVAAALRQRGNQLRLFRRPSQPVEPSRAEGEVFTGDLMDPRDLEQACAGAAAIYHIGPNMHPSEEQIGLNALQAAEQAGLRHFVYHSVLHPQIEAMPHHWRKLRVEEALLASKIPFTILQPTAYYQNVRHQWGDILASGEFQVPYRLETRLSQVDLRDVASVAASVTLEPEHYHASYPLVAEGPISPLGIAERMSQASGRTIRAVQVKRQDWAREAVAGGMEAGRVQDFLAMFAYYEDHDFLGNHQVLRMLLADEPRSMQQYFQELQRDQNG